MKHLPICLVLAMALILPLQGQSTTSVFLDDAGGRIEILNADALPAPIIPISEAAFDIGPNTGRFYIVYLDLEVEPREPLTEVVILGNGKLKIETQGNRYVLDFSGGRLAVLKSPQDAGAPRGD